MCESSERDGFVEKLCSASFGVPPHWICTSFGFELSDENMIHEGVEKHSANKKTLCLMWSSPDVVSRPTASEREISQEIRS